MADSLFTRWQDFGRLPGGVPAVRAGGLGVEPALMPLALSLAAGVVGEPMEIYIIGARPGSLITGVVPDGLILDSATRTIVGVPTLAGSYEFTLTETLTDAVGSPRATVLTVTVSDVIAPTYAFERVFVDALFGPRLTGMAADTTILGMQILDIRNHPAHVGSGLTTLGLCGTDHDAGPGGIYLIVCKGDPKIAANWKEYDDALAAGWLDHIAVKPASNPIFTNPDYTATAQAETINIAGQALINGVYEATYQVTNGVYVYGKQCTVRITSPDGIKWTSDREDYAIVPAPNIGFTALGNSSGPHTGYMKHYLNRDQFGARLFPAYDYDWVMTSLAMSGVGGAGGAFWGSNDLSQAPVYICSISGHEGIASDALSMPTAAYGAQRVGSRPDGFRRGAGGKVFAYGTCSAPAGAGFIAKGQTYEWEVNPARPWEPISYPRLVLDNNASYSAVLTAMSNIIEYDGEYLAFELGSVDDGTGKKNSSINLVVSPIAGQAEAGSDPLAFYRPADLTTVEADFTALTALPAGLTESHVGTVAPVLSYNASGLNVALDGNGATKGAQAIFGDPITLIDTEYVDIYFKTRSAAQTAHRQIAVGLSTGNSAGTVLAGSGLWMETSAAEAQKYFYKRYRKGTKTSQIGMTDYTFPGIANEPNITSRKMAGVRIWVARGYAEFIGADGDAWGGMGPAIPAIFDKGTVLYPFIYVGGISGTPTEIIEAIAISRKTGAGLGKMSAPRHLYNQVPLVHVNYEYDYYKIGDDEFGSLAAFRADPRVSQTAGGKDIIDLSGIAEGGQVTEGIVETVYQIGGALPSGSNQILWSLDDGADGASNDMQIRANLQTTGVSGARINISGAAAMSTDADVSNTVHTVNEPVHSFTSFRGGASGTAYLATSEGAAQINTGAAVLAGIERFIIGSDAYNTATELAAASIRDIRLYPTRWAAKTTIDVLKGIL